MLTTLIACLMTAAIANDRLRSRIYRAFIALFGDCANVQTLGAIEPGDCATDYADGVYQVRQPDGWVIAWFSGQTIRNLQAFGVDCAYTVQLAAGR